MLNKLYKVLALFVFLSLACFLVLLFCNKDSPHVTSPYGKDNIAELIQQRVEEFWDTDDLRSSKVRTEARTSANEKLSSCPEIPPDLVGQIYVSFNNKKTLEEISKEIDSPNLKGGRYKPPDCISLQKVAIIIPFRDRYEHLVHWLYYLHPILMRQQLEYAVYVINQDGEGVFNRAKLMNVGYTESLKDYDYDCFVFSDVDLVPMDDRNLYKCFDNPRHLAVAMDKFNFHLPYNNFFGGVSSLSKEQFLKINGFSNTFWGWGGEDDDTYNRIIIRGMSISRPDFMLGKYKMIKHNRDLLNEANPKNPGKLSRTGRDMGTDGMNSLRYTVKAIVKETLYTFISVDIGSPES